MKAWCWGVWGADVVRKWGVFSSIINVEDIDEFLVFQSFGFEEYLVLLDYVGRFRKYLVFRTGFNNVLEEWGYLVVEVYVLSFYLRTSFGFW